VMNPNSSGILHPSNLLFENHFRGTDTSTSFATIDLSALEIKAKKKSDFHNGP